MATEHDISYELQLSEWVKGNPLHRKLARVQGGECCPDFSCCKPELLATPEERQAFAADDRKGRDRFLMMFLGRCIELAGRRDVYITNGEHEKDQ